MLGQSFAPLGDPMEMQNQPAGGPVSPVQEAIRVLSLKIPRATGAGMGAIPTALMMGLGSAGLPGGGGGNPIEEFLRNLLGGVPGASAPTPNVIPGVGPGEPPPGTFNPGGFDDAPMPPPPTGPGGARGASDRGAGTGTAMPRTSFGAKKQPFQV